MDVLEAILQPYREGQPAIFVSGRSLYDLVIDAEGKIRPLLEALRRRCRNELGMAFLNFSLATGLDWDHARLHDERDRKTIEQALQAHRLLNIPQDEREVAHIFRGLSSLLRAPTEGLQWADGNSMRFVLIIEFSEHLMPSLVNGTQTDNQLIASELSHITGQSLALRTSGNFVVFHGRDGLIDELVCSALRHVRLQQPGEQEKQVFLDAALTLYTAATFEQGLLPKGIAHLAVNTPNRGLEALLRASHRSGRSINAKELAEQKNRDVEALSEQTLTPLETERVADLKLHGTNIRKPQQILNRLADALLAGDQAMPANVLLAGAPGTAKTDLAILTAYQGKAAAYQMLSPKGSLVGETERKARLQQRALKEWVPNVAFCDEITESLPLERNDFDGDSGASRAVTAALLTALSDESRRGRSLLIATTNRPWAMGAAMRSRFTIIPVLHPLQQDYPGIVITTAQRIAPGLALDANDRKVAQAGRILYEKGANPRHIRAALSNALLLQGALTPDTILFAANDLCADTDLSSAMYADLWAIKCCSSRSFLPWSDNPASYQFPPYIKEVVDVRTGDVNEGALNKKIEELRPYAKV